MQMPDHPNAAKARAALEAFVAGDIDGLAASITDDVVWHAPGTNRFSGMFEGKAAVLARFARMREAGIETSFEIHDVIANDEHVVALVHLHVSNADGASYDQQQVQVMHVRDGSLAELWTMNEDQAVLDVLLG
jgi:ketosteroid isomerase-like protein